MPEYRLYTINDLGHVRGRFVLHCRSEADALAMVEKHRWGGEMELWQGDRLVQAFHALTEDLAVEAVQDDRHPPRMSRPTSPDSSANALP